jgi:hypothetical protein
MPAHPTAFASYSWDDDTHKTWLQALATRLRTDGVDVRLDQWHSIPGNQLTHFMESEIATNDFVIIICTPKYKLKSDRRTGGVGYEGDIMTAEVFTYQNNLKFIPVLARGTWQEAAPTWLVGKHYIDLSDPSLFEIGYTELKGTLLGTRPSAPPLGPLPVGYVHPSERSSNRQNPSERANLFYQYAIRRFATVVEEEQLDINGLGFLDIVLVLDGTTDRKWYNDGLFLSALVAAYPNPNLSPSYLWRIYQGPDPKPNPYTIGDTYEELIFIARPPLTEWGYADFMIFDPDGQFFIRKAFVDDTWRDAEEDRGKYLEPVVQLLLISEAFVVASNYAQALGYGSNTNLHFYIRWTGLRGRQLVNRSRFLMQYHLSSPCRDHQVETNLSLPINPSRDQIIEKTTDVIKRLARAFGGYRFPEITVQTAINLQLDHRV